MVGNNKILVVDDNVKNLFLANSVLLDAGYSVITANNGDEGLSLAEKHLPDLILLDVLMPGLNGFEVCEKIKKTSNILNSIKIILVSGKSKTSDKVKGLNSGADDYLTKPYKLEELLARIQTQLKTKSIEESLKNSLSKSEHLAILGQISAGIAHDFKNILTASLAYESITICIESMMDCFEKNDIDSARKYYESAKKFCDNAESTLTQGLTLVNGITTFAKGAVSKQKIQSLKPIILDGLNLFVRYFERESVAVDSSLNGSSLLVKCNAGEVHQIILNLISNSIHAMEKSEIKKLKIRLEDKNNKVVLSVSDTGAGIPKNLINKIFDDYYTTKPAGKGAGIGLSTVKKIVTAYNGNIQVKSKTEKGTKFIITFPGLRKI